MEVRKLNRPSKERQALMCNLATDLAMKGRVETTLAKAKYLKSYFERYIITPAVKTYDKVKTVVKNYVNDKGEKTTREVIIDEPKKLNARRAIKNRLYTAQEPR